MMQACASKGCDSEIEFGEVDGLWRCSDECEKQETRDEVAEELRTLARCLEMGDELLNIDERPSLKQGQNTVSITVDCE